MPVSRALAHLFRIRHLEEDQHRVALESALGELHQLERALNTSVERGHRGRQLIETSAHLGALADRLAGIEELRSAGSHSLALTPRIAAAEAQVALRREMFLQSRIERRQAETLLGEASRREAAELLVRDQRAIDDAHAARVFDEKAARDGSSSAAPSAATSKS